LTAVGAGAEGWFAAQRALLRARLEHGPVARHRVKIQWWPAPAGGRGPDVVGWLARLFPARRSPGSGGYVVAVYEPDAPVGAAPLVLVRAGSASPPAERGRGVATALGDVEPAGALVIEARGWEAVPVEPPAAPGEGAPPWTETGAPGPD
jgi:hypothetical protein